MNSEIQKKEALKQRLESISEQLDLKYQPLEQFIAQLDSESRIPLAIGIQLAKSFESALALLNPEDIKLIAQVVDKAFSVSRKIEDIQLFLQTLEMPRLNTAKAIASLILLVSFLSGCLSPGASAQENPTNTNGPRVTETAQVQMPTETNVDPTGTNSDPTADNPTVPVSPEAAATGTNSPTETASPTFTVAPIEVGPLPTEVTGPENLSVARLAVTYTGLSNLWGGNKEALEKEKLSICLPIYKEVALEIKGSEYINNYYITDCRGDGAPMFVNSEGQEIDAKSYFALYHDIDISKVGNIIPVTDINQINLGIDDRLTVFLTNSEPVTYRGIDGIGNPLRLVPNRGKDAGTIPEFYIVDALVRVDGIAADGSIFRTDLLRCQYDATRNVAPVVVVIDGQNRFGKIDQSTGEITAYYANGVWVDIAYEDTEPTQVAAVPTQTKISATETSGAMHIDMATAGNMTTLTWGEGLNLNMQTLPGVEIGPGPKANMQPIKGHEGLYSVWGNYGKEFHFTKDPLTFNYVDEQGRNITAIIFELAETTFKDIDKKSQESYVSTQLLAYDEDGYVTRLILLAQGIDLDNYPAVNNLTSKEERMKAINGLIKSLSSINYSTSTRRTGLGEDFEYHPNDPERFMEFVVSNSKIQKAITNILTSGAGGLGDNNLELIKQAIEAGILIPSNELEGQVLNIK
ncbi:MAG: hypothetical protein ACOZAN_03615 [Patescibacteria group bacterium]